MNVESIGIFGVPYFHRNPYGFFIGVPVSKLILETVDTPISDLEEHCNLWHHGAPRSPWSYVYAERYIICGYPDMAIKDMAMDVFPWWTCQWDHLSFHLSFNDGFFQHCFILSEVRMSGLRIQLDIAIIAFHSISKNSMDWLRGESTMDFHGFLKGVPGNCAPKTIGDSPWIMVGSLGLRCQTWFNFPSNSSRRVFFEP